MGFRNPEGATAAALAVVPCFGLALSAASLYGVGDDMWRLPGLLGRGKGRRSRASGGSGLSTGGGGGPEDQAKAVVGGDRAEERRDLKRRATPRRQELGVWVELVGRGGSA